MMPTAPVSHHRARQIGSSCMAALIALGSVGVVFPAPAFADVGTWTTAGPGERVTAVAVDPTNDQHVLAAGETGVWSSMNGGGAWAKISGTQIHQALAIDPHAANSIYGISSDSKSVLKSADGGATWAAAYTGAGQTHVNTVVVDAQTMGTLLVGVSYTDGLAQVLRSTDAGATWTAVLPANLRGMGGIGATNTTTLATLPGVSGLAFAGIQIYHGGHIAKSADAGATWTGLPYGALAPLAAPSALSAAGKSAASATIYAGLNVMQFGTLLRSDDAGATWADLTPNLPFHGPQGGYVANLTTNPAQPLWAYMSEWDTATPAHTGVFATNDRGASWNELGHLEPRANGPQGLALAIPSRTLYAATDGGVYQLTIAWPVISQFQAYYAGHDGFRLLGTGISLETALAGRATQYFEKGRLEDHSGESADPNWQLMYGLLVDDLHGSPAPLPVGGDVSTLSYAGLHTLADASQRVAPPAGYPGSGTFAVGADGDTFVPFTSDLSGAPGHVVAGPFWDYLNRTDLFPGGWLHDVGLPISPATDVTVTKFFPDGPATRAITVQAFQRTVLTLDPLNAADWQVERANVGSDYRRFYTDRVGP